LINGITGLHTTPHGTPACPSTRTASSRSAGAGANGSISRASRSSSVVMVMFTETLFRRAMVASRSTSRATRSDFVVIQIRRPRSPEKTSSMPRVIA
jgi:hypothetical protein